jgi:hypothetical protein
MPTNMRFKIVSLCVGMFVTGLSVASLLLGWHRATVQMTSFAAGSTCFFAADVWGRKYLLYVGYLLWVASFVFFFHPIR